MSLALPLFPFVLLLLLVIGVLLTVRRARRSRQGQVAADPEEQVVAGVRWCSLVLGVLLAWIVVGTDALGRDLVLAPMVLGGTLLAGAALAELLVRPRYLPGPRQADLSPRRVRDHLPRGFTGLLAVTAVAGLAVCTYTLLSASADDLGRAGRTYDWECGALSEARSPYPGSFYATPYLVGLAVATVLAALTLRVVVRRPLGGTPQQAARHRAVGVDAVLGAWGVVLAAPLAGIAFFAATRLLGAECVPAGATAVGWFAAALVVLSVVSLAVSLGRLLLASTTTGSTAARERVGVDA